MRYPCAVVRLEQAVKTALPCVVVLLAACESPPETASINLAVRPPASAKLVSATLQRSGESETTSLSLVLRDGQWVGNVQGLDVSASYVVVARASGEEGSIASSVHVNGVDLAAGRTGQVLVAIRPSDNGASSTSSPPQVDTLWVSADEVDVGERVSLRASAHSADAKVGLSYAWTASCGRFGQAQGETTTWIAPATADLCELALTVSDAQGGKASASAKVQVGSAHGSARMVVVINDAPRVAGIQATPSPMATNQVVALSVSASDPDGDALSYRWRCSCAGRFSDLTQAATTFVPTLASGTEHCTFSVEVTDGRGGIGAGSLALSSKQPMVHVGPTMGVTVQSTDNAGPGELVTFHAQASSSDGGSLTWTWSASAGTLSGEVDQASTSDIRWTAPAMTVDPCTITATATDAWGTSASYLFAVKM
jgi:hypothetical protein